MDLRARKTGVIGPFRDGGVQHVSLLERGLEKLEQEVDQQSINTSRIFSNLQTLRQENMALKEKTDLLARKVELLEKSLEDAVEAIHTLWDLPCGPGGQECIERAKLSYAQGTKKIEN